MPSADNKLKISSGLLEIVILLVFSMSFLMLGPANILDHRIAYTHPYNILSSDAAGEISYVDGLVKLGNYRHITIAQCAGFDDCIGFLSILTQHLQAIFSLVSGLGTFNTNILFACIFMLVSCLLMFLIVEKWNVQIAFLSLPLMLFAFMPQFRIGILWGYYDAALAAAFLLAASFLLGDSIHKNWFIITVLIAAAFLAHVNEIAYIAIIFLIHFAAKFVRERKIDLSLIPVFLKMGLIGGILIIYLAIVLNACTPGSAIGLLTETEKPQWYDASLENFGLFKALILIGVVASLFLFAKDAPMPITVGLVMFFVGLNLLSIFLFRISTRYLWPIYLAVFPGIAIYLALQFLRLNKRVISFALATALVVYLSFANYQPLASTGLIDDAHWQALKWLENSTDMSSKILFLYGDPYSQDGIFWNSYRPIFRVNEDSFIQKIRDGRITKYFTGHRPYSLGVLNYWSPFPKVTDHVTEANLSYFSGERNICLFDYVALDKVSQEPVLAQYNLLLANKMLESKSFVIAYQNSEVAILKSIMLNESCIQEAMLNAQGN